jgi:hypothetical protein
VDADRPARDLPRVLWVRPVLRVAAGLGGAGTAALVLGVAFAGRGDGRRVVHDARLAGRPGRSRFPASTGHGGTGQLRRAARKVCAGSGVGVGRPHRARSRRGRAAPARRRRGRRLAGRRRGGGARRGRADPAVDVNAGDQALLVGADRGAGDRAWPLPAGTRPSDRPSPRADRAAAAGAPPELGRACPRARLDGPRLAGARRASVAAPGRDDRRRDVRAAPRDRRLRACLLGRAPAGGVPQRDRRARGHPDRRARPGGTARRRAGHRHRRPPAHHGLRPGVGVPRADDGPS